MNRKRHIVNLLLLSRRTWGKLIRKIFVNSLFSPHPILLEIICLLSWYHIANNWSLFTWHGDFPLVECPKTKHSKNNNEEKSKQALNDSIFTLYDFLMIILVVYLKIYFEWLSGDYRWITHLKCLTLKHKNAREWKPGAFKLYIHCLSNLPNHSYRSVSSLTEHSSQGARLLSGICEFSKIIGKVWFCCDF